MITINASSVSSAPSVASPARLDLERSLSLRARAIHSGGVAAGTAGLRCARELKECQRFAQLSGGRFGARTLHGSPQGTAFAQAPMRVFPVCTSFRACRISARALHVAHRDSSFWCDARGRIRFVRNFRAALDRGRIPISKRGEPGARSRSAASSSVIGGVRAPRQHGHHL